MSTPVKPDYYVNVIKAKEYLGISRSSIIRLVADGKLNGKRFGPGGKTIVISLREIKRYQDECQIVTTYSQELPLRFLYKRQDRPAK